MEAQGKRQCSNIKTHDVEQLVNGRIDSEKMNDTIFIGKEME